MATSNPTHSHKTTLCTYICSIIQIQSVSLQNIINNNTCTIVRRILICFSVRSACTWKIVFKTQNNEVNELSECMLYKMFLFSGKHLKTVKLSFTIIFQKPCLLLKVYKTFNTFLLALLCFSLKVYKTFLNSLACFTLLALKVYKNFL